MLFDFFSMNDILYRQATKVKFFCLYEVFKGYNICSQNNKPNSCNQM